MIYQGKALTVDLLPSRVAHLVFDLEGSSVNKFNQQTLEELQAAVAKLQNTNIKGVIFPVPSLPLLWELTLLNLLRNSVNLKIR
jgi:hypothetical protein